jgi:hypothetical protein
MTWRARPLFATGDLSPTGAPALAQFLRAWRKLDPTAKVPELSTNLSAGNINLFVGALSALCEAFAPIVEPANGRSLAVRRQLPARFHDTYAKEWYGTTPTPGRPRGTGSFTSEEEFVRAVAGALNAVVERGRKPTQEAIAGFFCETAGVPDCRARQLRKWSKQFNFRSWQDVLSQARLLN